MSEYQDKTIVCLNKGREANCEGEFWFEAGEQEFFARNGYTEPKRCKSCRDKKKIERMNSGGNFNGNNNKRRNDHGRGPRIPSNDDLGGEGGY